jgi:uncharacterized protein YceK
MMLRLLPLLLLTGCSTVPSYISCDNAEMARTAAKAALRALDNACPIIY